MKHNWRDMIRFPDKRHLKLLQYSFVCFPPNRNKKIELNLSINISVKHKQNQRAANSKLRKFSYQIATKNRKWKKKWAEIKKEREKEYRWRADFKGTVVERRCRIWQLRSAGEENLVRFWWSCTFDASFDCYNKPIMYFGQISN